MTTIYGRDGGSGFERFYIIVMAFPRRSFLGLFWMCFFYLRIEDLANYGGEAPSGGWCTYVNNTVMNSASQLVQPRISQGFLSHSLQHPPQGPEQKPEER